MSLVRLSSTSVRATALPGTPPAAHAVRRIEAQSGADGERERSLRQEIDEIDPEAIADFHGEGHVRAQAHAIAGVLSHLGRSAERRLLNSSIAFPAVDDKV